jgi:glucosylceramidase
MRKIYIAITLVAVAACQQQPKMIEGTTAYQTSAAGDKLAIVEPNMAKANITITLKPEEKFQTITGFGGAFTESSAHLLWRMSKANQQKILQAYFGDDGARYSLTRTHMNSCDFSLNQYSYAPVAGDTALSSFSIDEDRADIIPMIKAAQSISTEGFKIIASPWTAPPWMKDNKDWFGGTLLPEYYPAWAKFFSRYAEAYAAEGIPIWAFTVENEPLGNGANWESMHYTPTEMADFVKHHLSPQLKKDAVDAHILVYDQNRGEELEHWANVLLTDNQLLPLIYGTAVHWYTGTEDWFPESLQHTHNLAPEKGIIHTEGCIDAEVPHWNDDAWYWKKEATDWGYDWAPEKDKPLHPKYVPTYRYARDIIGCLNNWVEGWVDWNMILDDKGGPNHAKNWCIAPILVKPETDQVYITPLYYMLSHFSKYIRPGAVRIGFENTDETLMVTAAQNPDGSTVVVVLNTAENPKTFEVLLNGKKVVYAIAAQALQTIIIPKNS